MCATSESCNIHERMWRHQVCDLACRCRMYVKITTPAPNTYVLLQTGCEAATTTSATVIAIALTATNIWQRNKGAIKIVGLEEANRILRKLDSVHFWL